MNKNDRVHPQRRKCVECQQHMIHEIHQCLAVSFPTTPHRPMSAQDLCVELWLEILSYTPKSALHKLVGLNPLLSELALDRLYDEVAFVGHVRETKTMFDQVMMPDIARRVRSVTIELQRIPDTPDEPCHPVESIHSAHLTPSCGLLRCIDPYFWIHASGSRVKSMVPSSMETLTMAQIALCRFPYTQTLQIKVHDHNMTKAFSQFLTTISHRKSLPLRHLSIDTTISHLAAWLEPLEHLLEVYGGLETFHLAITRSDVVWMHQFHAKRVLSSLFSILQHHLTSLTIADPLIMRIPGFFSTLPIFGRLKSFEFITTFMAGLHGEPDPSTFLTQFIQDHSETLEYLTVEHKDEGPYPSHWSSPYLYTAWLLSLEPLGTSNYDHPRMPRLKSLRVGFHGISLNAGANRERLFPELTTFAPNLISLDISDSVVSPMHLYTIIDHLPTCRGVRSLERLTIYVNSLSVNDIDTLAVKLPKLTSLEIVIPFWMSLREECWACQVGIATIECRTSYRRALSLQEERYSRNDSTWASLMHFRVSTKVPRCDIRHPVDCIMTVLANRMPTWTSVDHSYHCDCKTTVPVGC
ncbi:hypothetical protein BJ165DRAFT_379263 [Panaeolus papilionaceus]|nr:hypothetical protein BJ165DRAFT_379263 [Panaeolus papilionaceus]